MPIWNGRRYELQRNRNGETPELDLYMAPSCDVLLLTSHVGNEKTYTMDYQKYLDLAIKQTGVTKKARQVIDSLREKILDVTRKG